MSALDSDDRPWKVLIVDDEPEVHFLTRTILKDVRFDGRPLLFLSAHNDSEARRIVTGEPDIALILMDVVMEEETTGLELIHFIREELGNKHTRIIVRTGAADTVPEKRIIIDYEINDYKVKTDLTSPRLFTSVIKSLRNFRDLENFRNINRELEQSRERLDRVVKTSSEMFTSKSLREFFSRLIDLTSELLNHRGIVGLYNMDKPADHLPPEIFDTVGHSGQFTRLTGDYFIGALISEGKTRISLISDGCTGPDEGELQMLELFFTKMNILHGNLILKEDSQAALSEMVTLVGDVVENRAYKAGRELLEHQNRVSSYAVILARKLGLPEDDILVFNDAVKLHDTGKIGIIDSILDKPGPLTNDEFEIMKTHTAIGYDVLKFSSRKLFQMAATIAREHHERWDGTGYPRGLSGDRIHPLGRITGIVDVFDALSSKRIYRDAWDFDQTIQFIRDGRGSQFDPHMVDLFLQEIDLIRDITARGRTGK